MLRSPRDATTIVLAAMAGVAVVLGLATLLLAKRAPEAPPVVELRYQDLLSGIIGMQSDPAVSLRPDQARRMLADMQSLRADLLALFQLQNLLNTRLTQPQWAYIVAHRWDDLTRMGVPIPVPYDQMPDPLKTVSYAAALVDEEARQPPETPPAQAYAPPINQRVSWFHISQSVIYFHATRHELDFTPSQAQSLQPYVRQMAEHIASITRLEPRVIAVLDQGQRQWIMRHKFADATRQIEGRPIIEGRNQPTIDQVVAVVAKLAQP